MSYILDALRKAEAQRARGAIPSVHSPAPHLMLDRLSPGSGHPALQWAGGVVVLGLVGAGAWYFGRTSSPPDGQTDAASRAATALAAARAESPRSITPAATPQPAEPPRQATAAVVSTAATPTRQPVKTPTGTGTAPAPGATPSPPVQHLATERRAAAQPVSEPAAIAPIDALPSATRSQLPKLSLGGSIYSDDPAARFLIINGSTFHQGDPVAPDLVLEQIGPHDAVLNFKGQHFRLAF